MKIHCEHCKKEIKHTGLYDILNKPIYYGNVVHWTDGQIYELLEVRK